LLLELNKNENLPFKKIFKKGLSFDLTLTRELKDSTAANKRLKRNAGLVGW